MSFIEEERYMNLYEELCLISEEILPYYDIDKIKSYSVYIWTKGNEGQNVFDICSDEIIFYDETHQILEDAKPVIKKIQAKLREIEQVCDD